MASIIGNLLGAGAAGVVNAVGDQVNKKVELEADITKTEIGAATQVAIAQNAVNQVEAASEDNYTRRARPTIMYICGVGFGYQYILQPFIVLIVNCLGKNIVVPTLDMTAIGTVLLGLCGLRSFEKMKK